MVCFSFSPFFIAITKYMNGCCSFLPYIASLLFPQIIIPLFFTAFKENKPVCAGSNEQIILLIIFLRVFDMTF